MPIIDLKEATSRSFDYIVVGGGTAGLTLAARLTEDVESSVLVLEAGEDLLDDPHILNLGNFGYHFEKEEYDWRSKTVPQTHSNNTQFQFTRGRMLGGSSGINFMGYNKPSKADIDAWERLGNEGWNWERFDKYMCRAITYIPPEYSETEHIRRGTPEHIKGLWRKGVQGNGPIKVSHCPLRLDVDIRVQQMLESLGIPAAAAPLAGDPSGMSTGPMTVDPKTVTRSYAANAYWAANSSRPNLHLLTGALAHRLLSDDSNGELDIKGVEFSYRPEGERVWVANATKEVILSTGAIKTPQILELSGIGRPDILQQIGVPLRLALDGVGENVQEHLNIGASFELKDGVSEETFDILRDPEQVKKHLELFARHQGIFTMGINNYAFTHPSVLSDKANEIISEFRSKIEAEIAAGHYSPSLAEQYRILFDSLNKGVPSCEVIGFPGFISFPNPPKPGKKYYTILAALNAPFSRGTIHAVTSDPHAQPAIDPHFFEQEIDLKIFAEVFKFCRNAGNNPAMEDFFGKTPVEINPGPKVTSDEELRDFIKSWAGTTFHAVGSASMLPKEKGGVVDTRLKVYGTRNLRVADLSIVPLHFGSHSQSVAYGIGEIAADIIEGIA